MLGGRGFFRFHTLLQKEVRMTTALIAASSVLALLITLAWAKEFRLRRALQSLLARVFSQWRNNETSSSRHDVPGSADFRSRRVR